MPPFIKFNQRVAFAILCALEVCTELFFVQWAKKWLNGTDRSRKSADRTKCRVTHMAEMDGYMCIPAWMVANMVYHGQDVEAYAWRTVDGVLESKRRIDPMDAVTSAEYTHPDIEFVKLAHEALKYQ